MAIQAGGLHHLSIRVTDLARAKRFYTDTLGFQEVLEVDELVLVNAQGTLIGIRGNAPETDKSDQFNPFRIGLDHLALAAESAESLQDLKSQLDAAGIPNNGVQDDELTKAQYICFFDPDGIPWEFYAMPG